TRASPPACIRLLTSRQWLPFPVGKSDVRNSNPLISPFTLNLPRVPQTFLTSKGRRIITQPRREGGRSRVATKDFTTRFGIVFIRDTSSVIAKASESRQIGGQQVPPLNCIPDNVPSLPRVAAPPSPYH